MRLHIHGLILTMEHSEPLAWKRTGKITLRAEPYLVIRYPGPRYTALHGPQCSREILGKGLETADAAKAVCEAHKEMVNNDTPA
jgi:hypothetical protein